MASISIRNLVKRYGNFAVIPDLNLEISDHEFVVFVGPSGCGKSTLLRIIAGLEPITAGEVYIGDRRVNGIPAAQRDIAMVFQDYALYPHMRVYDNMSFALELRGTPKAEIDARVKRAAALLHIEPYLDRKPKELSGGQRQRVAMGRAIVRNPKAFLFDEPLSNLDAKLRGQVRAEIKALSQELKTTMVFVTHDQIEAMTMADRIVVLQSGTVQQYDTPEAVYERPANQFVAGFIGSPAMNFFPVEWRGEGVVFSQSGAAVPLGDAELRPAAPGRQGRARNPSRAFCRGGGSGRRCCGDDQAGRAARLGYADPFRPRRRLRDCARRSVAAAEGRRPPQPSPAAGKNPSVRQHRRRGAAVTAHEAIADMASKAGQVRIICLGLSALDQVWRVDRFFSGKSEKIRSQDYATLGGGMAANAAVTGARLGGSIAFWGRAGDDAAGREMRSALAAEAIDVANFRLFPDGRSSVSGIIVDGAGERRIVNFRGVFPETATWLPLDAVAQASAVLADPRWVEGAIALFGKARALRIPTVLDGDVADAEVFERLLPLTDHAVFSEPALVAFAGSADDASLNKLARFNCRVVAVTRGGEGVSWYENGRLQRRAAYPVSVVDTTGAGDVFHGAYVFAIGAGLEVQRCHGLRGCGRCAEMYPLGRPRRNSFHQ